MLLSPPDIGAPFMDGEFAGVSIHRSLTVWIWPYSSLHPDNYWAPSPKVVALSGTGAMLCDLMLSEQSWTGGPKHLSLDPLAKSKTLALPVLLVDEKVMCLRRGFDNFEEFKEHLGLTDPRE